jgi:protein TonB
MEKPTHQLVEPPPIDAQLIEQPETQSIQPERPAAAPVRPLQAPVMPPVSPRTKPKVEVAANAVAEPSDARAAPSVGQATAGVEPSANGGATAGPYEGMASSRGGIYANGGAQAIVRPMPQIPEDLREEAFNSTALARFHIAADGSVTVELAKPTPNPRLNRILLDCLKKWVFIPAIKNGMPVDSTEEIVVKIEVK